MQRKIQSHLGHLRFPASGGTLVFNWVLIGYWSTSFALIGPCNCFGFDSRHLITNPTLFMILWETSFYVKRPSGTVLWGYISERDLPSFLSSNVSSSSPITNATLVSAHSTVMSPPRTTPNSTRPCVNNESQSKTRTFCGFRDLFSFSSVAGTSTKAYLDESKNGKWPARYPSINLSWYCLSLS